MFRKLLLTAAVAVAVGVLSPSAAKADFTLTLSSTGTASVTLDFTTSPGTPSSPITVGGLTYFLNVAGQEVVSGTYAGYTLSMSISTSSPVDVPSGQVTQGTLTVASAAATAALGIAINSSGFNSSATPVTAYDSISATAMNGGALSAATTTVTGATSGSETTSPIGMSTTGFVQSGNVTTSLVGAINVSDTITVGDTVSTLGDTFTFTSDLYTAPVPSGLILAATVVPFFGLLRRRLNSMKAPVVA